MTKQEDIFWEFVNRRCSELGISSFRELSKLANLSHGTLAHHVNFNQIPPTLKVMRQLSIALEVDIVELLYYAGEVGEGKYDPNELRIIHALQSLDDDKKEIAAKVIESMK